MKRPDQKLVGFALETHNEMAHALDKLRRKHLDAIVLNSLNNPGAGFGHDTNQITLIDAEGTSQEFALAPKSEIADHIVHHLWKKHFSTSS